MSDGKIRKPPRVGKLDSPDSIRRELSRLYRTCRITAGHAISPADGAKLAGMLGNLWRSMELSAIDVRLAEIERKLTERRQ